MYVADETLLRYQGVHRTARPRYLAMWKGLLAYLSIASHFKTFFYSAGDLAALESSEAVVDVMLECAEVIAESVGSRGYQFVSAQVVEVACRKAADLYSIEGDHRFAMKELPAAAPAAAPMKIKIQKVLSSPRPQISEGLVDAVDKLLPEQPWKPGMHILVAKELGAEARDVSKAIARLIALGRRYDERDGVVFDKSGNVISVDESRRKAPSGVSTT